MKLPACRDAVRRGSNNLNYGSPGTTIRITYSAGIASRGSGDDYESLLLKADRALYRTKANGKNNIHIFNGS